MAPVIEKSEVMEVVATEDSQHVFSYLYPGCVVYQASGDILLSGYLFCKIFLSKEVNLKILYNVVKSKIIL